mgnify:FL=1
MKNKTLVEQNFQDVLTASLWRVIGWGVIGFLLGYMVYRNSEKEGKPDILYLWVVLAGCLIIGIIISLCKVIPAYRKVLKERKNKQEALNND